MSSEGATTEVEEAEQGKYSPVVYFNYFRNNPRAVVSPLLYLVAAWAYYTLSKKFLYNSLLNLTAGRIERLSDSPFILFEATETIEVIEATSLNITAAL